MKKPSSGNRALWPGFHGPNQGYVDELYEIFLQDPESVDADMREYFEQNSELQSSYSNESNQIIPAVKA